MYRVKASVLLFDAALIGVVGRGFAAAIWVAALGHAALVTTSGVALAMPEATSGGWSLYAATQLGAPLVSTIQCLIGAGLFWRARAGGALRLFGLYMGAVGAVALAGDWLGVIVGNYSEVALALNVPPVLMRVAATAPFAVLIVVLWRIGRRLQPAVDAVVLPALAVALLLPVISLPTTWSSIARLWFGQASWVAVFVGALVRRPQTTEPAVTHSLRLYTSAWLLALLLILIVRLMVQGVPFGTWPRS